MGRRGGWAEWLSRERLLSAILIPGGREKDDPVGGPPVHLPPPSSTFLRRPALPWQGGLSPEAPRLLHCLLGETPRAGGRKHAHRPTALEAVQPCG